MSDTIDMPSASDAGANYTRGAASAGAAYTKGIQRTSNEKWKSAATSETAKQNYATNVQKAISEGKREAKLANVSDWQQRALSKGASNIGQAMAQSADKFARGYDTGVRAKLQGLQLPPRTTDGMQNLVNRAGAVVQALQKK